MADKDTSRIVEAAPGARVPTSLEVASEKAQPIDRVEAMSRARSIEDMLNGKEAYYGAPHADPEANVGISESLLDLPNQGFGSSDGFGLTPARTLDEATDLTASIVAHFGGGELSIRTHEDRLRKEMTVAQEVWREDAPVVPIGQGQAATDHRDQQHTAAWAEARFLVAGREDDVAAVRIAAELAVGGRGLDDPAKDAKELATAITTVYGAEKAQQESGSRTQDSKPGITYEGIDASKDEDRWLQSMDLPGEKVRIDTEARIHGVDIHDLMDQLGMDPLTISKSIVRTEMNPDGMGGQREGTYLEYEFEGKEGRHTAKQFMEEGGREHMYAVMLVKNDRMWAAPMVEDRDRGDGSMLLEGPAVEIVGFTGKDLDQLHPEGFAAFLGEVREENGVAGEFYVQARDGFGSQGPVNIMNSPWSSSVSPDERVIAEAAIDKAIAKETREREDPVGVLVDAMRDTSKVWRLERERVDFTGRHGSEFHAAPPEADEKTALGLARAEANHLMRGRDSNSAHVRQAAAMVATEGRPVSNNTGDLNATNLADSLSPGPKDSRKGVLAQAAASLSTKTSAAAPARGPAEAQNAIDHVASRNGGNSR